MKTRIELLKSVRLRNAEEDNEISSLVYYPDFGDVVQDRQLPTAARPKFS